MYLASEEKQISRYHGKNKKKSSLFLFHLCKHSLDPVHIIPEIMPDQTLAGPRSAVGNVSGYRCVSDCRSRVASLFPVRSHTFVEIDHEMISTAILLPSADSFIQEGLLSVTSESMCMKFWLTACSSLPRKKCGKVN